VALRPGTSPQRYANAVSAALGSSYSVIASGGASRYFDAVITLVAMLTILIMAGAGLGVQRPRAQQPSTAATMSGARPAH
jgi:hypothetical protein